MLNINILDRAGSQTLYSRFWIIWPCFGFLSTLATACIQILVLVNLSWDVPVARLDTKQLAKVFLRTSYILPAEQGKVGCLSCWFYPRERHRSR